MESSDTQKMDSQVLRREVAKALNALLGQPEFTAFTSIQNVIDGIEKLRKERPDLGLRSLSSNAVRNARDGRVVIDRTAHTLWTFLNEVAPTLTGGSLRQDGYLDLHSFFDGAPGVLGSFASDLVGDDGRVCYQSYAFATSITQGPHPTIMRLGKVVFTYDAQKSQLRISEYQYRPKMEDIDELRIEWEGSVAVRGTKLFALMRTVDSYIYERPLFAVMWSDGPYLEGMQTDRMTYVSVGYDPGPIGEVYPSFPKVLLVRQKEDEIVTDFCLVEDVDQDVVDFLRPVSEDPTLL